MYVSLKKDEFLSARKRTDSLHDDMSMKSNVFSNKDLPNLFDSQNFNVNKFVRIDSNSTYGNKNIGWIENFASIDTKNDLVSTNDTNYNSRNNQL